MSGAASFNRAQAEYDNRMPVKERIPEMVMCPECDGDGSLQNENGPEQCPRCAGYGEVEE